MASASTDVPALVARALAGDRLAAEDVLRSIQDDVYALSLRMLGERAAAEDATQEILVKVLTHLAQWRADSKLSTWVHTIAVRHVLSVRRTRMEEMCSFESLTSLCEAGEQNPPLPAVAEGELKVLERELRLVCTQGMLLSLDRDHRIAWILDSVFELESELAAQVLEIEPATFRKRLQRSRERLGSWMDANCGLVGVKTRCHCKRQIPVGIQVGVVVPAALQLATHPVRERGKDVPLKVLQHEGELIERAANILCAHPDYAAPERVLEGIRQLISSNTLSLFTRN